MLWIYLSPHFDDAVYSCGGLIHHQVKSGQQVEIWTVCAAGPQGPLTPFAESLHTRWQTGPEAVEIRRIEDQEACRRVGAASHYWDIPDCIYRYKPDGSPLINEENDLFKSIGAEHNPLLEEVVLKIRTRIPPQAHIVSPLAIGNHVDHQFVATLAQRLSQQLWFYADYPYAGNAAFQMKETIRRKIRPVKIRLTEEDFLAWVAAAAAYTSQISTFWKSEEAMNQAFRNYWERNGRNIFWVETKAKGGN